MKLAQILLILILLAASLLRFYKIDEVPHGLYIDEVSIGYNAYTILTKGVDEHGIAYPLFFEAFGEYKMPVAIYLTSVSIAALGKDDLAVRFPSALFGTLTVLLMYLFVRKLSLETGNWKLEIPIVAAALLAITPWHIQLSRGGFEANIALFLYVLGGLLFLHFLQNKNKLFLLSSFVAFLLTVYTYNAYRLMAPLTIIFVMLNSIQHLKQIIRSRNKFGMTLVIACFLIIFSFFLPMLQFSLTANGAQRFSSQSTFAEYEDLSVVQKAVVYPAVYMTNYFSYFSFSYLFTTGDGNGRHSVIGMGSLFRWEFVFFLVGCYFLFRQRKEFAAKVTFFLLLLAPATGALTNPSPHGLRSFLMVLPLTIIVAYGIVTLWKKKFLLRKVFFAVFLLIALFEFVFYLHQYYVHYPIRTAPDWGGAYKEVILEATKEQQQQYSRIVVNDNVGMINNYRNFYNDKLVYELVNDDWLESAELGEEKILYITSSSEKRNYGLQKVPHTLIKDIPLESSHKGIFVQFWEL